MPVENWQRRNDRRTKRSDCRVVVSAKLKWLTVGGRPDGEAFGGRIRLTDRKKGGGGVLWMIDTVCTENQEGREGMWNPVTEWRFSECQENF